MSRKRHVRIAPSHYHVGHIVPAMVASEMSFFEDEGLEDYEIVGGGIIPAMVEKVALRRAMKEKSIDIVPDAKPLSVFTLRDKGEDLYIVGCWRNSQDACYVGSKQVKKLADLKGKKIGTRDLGGIGYTLLATNLRKAGLDPDRDVTWVTGSRFHQQENPLEYLRRGEVDCVPLPHDCDVEDVVSEGYSVVFDSKDYGGVSRPSRITASTREMIEERGEELQSYFRAIIRAYWFMVDRESNERYLRALVRRLRRDCLDLDESQRTNMESGGRSVVPIDGAPSVEGLRHILDEAQGTGQISRSLQLDQALNLEAVHAAFNELQHREELGRDILRAREIYALRNPVPARATA